MTFLKSKQQPLWLNINTKALMPWYAVPVIVVGSKTPLHTTQFYCIKKWAEKLIYFFNTQNQYISTARDWLLLL